MKTKSLFLLWLLLTAAFWQNASAQCQASFVMNQQPGTGTIVFTNTSSGNYSALSWYFGDGSTSSQPNPSHTYAPGIYGVCLTIWDSLSACQSTHCDTLVIANGGGCQAYFSPNIQGNSVQFINASTGPYTQVSWSFGDGSSSSIISPTHQYAQPGLYTVCLTVGDSNTACYDTYCSVISIQGGSNCDASFTASDSMGLTFFFPLNYSTGYSYFWTFGDGNTSTAPYPAHQYASQGTYLVCLTLVDSASGCTDTYCDSVSNLPPVNCIAGFSYQQSNGSAYFNGFNAGSFSGVSSYTWSFGDGSNGSGQFPVHTYANAGNYTVCLTIVTYSGCVDSVCNTISINSSPSCSANFTFSQQNGVASFYPNTTGGAISSYYWTFGDGGTASNQYPSHSYASAGTYQVCLTITTTTGCVDTVCQQITITGGANCQAYFSASSLAGNAVSFLNLSSGSPGYFYWTFGDGTTSTQMNPTHTYAASGYYVACLTIIDSTQGCSDTWCDTVYAGNSAGNCNAQFSVSNQLSTYIFNPAVSQYDVYYWTFGDGTVSYATFPTHIYSNPGSYLVCLTVTDSSLNCTATWCDTLVIPGGAGCQAYFSYSTDTVTNTTYFTNLSQGSFTNVVWTFGDGSSSTSFSPNHTYTTAGTYLVCLTVYNNSGCQSSYCDSIVIGSGANCIPQFYAIPDSSIGNGNVTFIIANNCSGWQYVWSFGDSTNGSGPGPFIHQYNATGWYYVCVNAYDSFGNVITWCDSVYAWRIGGSTGLSELNNAIPVKVFPNPASGPFTLQFQLSQAGPLIIEVLSIQGQLIQRMERDYPSGLSEIRLDPSMWDAGMYILRLKNAEQQTLSRFSIQH
ncbi:MAG: PKD domain-containing protein [Bacteroidia bacterium]|nr:PKD domain-containing protein [Bacteroidia bacterium]